MDQITLIKIIGDLATLQQHCAAVRSNLQQTAENVRQMLQKCVPAACAATADARVTLLIFKQPIETRQDGPSSGVKLDLR